MTTRARPGVADEEPCLGAWLEGPGARFRLWASDRRRCAVRLHGAAGARDVPLDARGDGLFDAWVEGVGAGARYRFVLDGEEVGDPWARWLPDGVAAPAELYRSSYRFTHPRVDRPLAEHAIYEIHLGTFTTAGTCRAAIERLPALVELGVTAIELMPVHAFAGERGWGYDGVAHFAPHAAYGAPDDLRALIDAAHGHGLAVLLDVVYNHFGPAGNVLPRYSGAYLTRSPTGWGEAPDYRTRWMRRFVLENLRMWVDDYRIDGFRFDAAHAIVDPSRPTILRQAADLIGDRALLIAEDDRNDPAILDEDGFDAVWADDFHHALHVVLTGEQDGYYAAYPPSVSSIARAIERGWLFEGQPFVTAAGARDRGRPADGVPASALIFCLQNHDQVGNRALGDRLSAAISPAAYRAASTVLLFLPMTPLLFMGQEWAASTPFCYFTDHAPELGAKVSAGRRQEFASFTAFADPAARERIPDPQARATFERSRLRWDERAAGEHGETLALYRALLALRRTDPVLRASTRAGLSARAEGPLLIVRRAAGGEARTLVANLSGAAVAWPPIGGEVVLSSTPVTPGAPLPAWSAAILSGGAR